MHFPIFTFSNFQINPDPLCAFRVFVRNKLLRKQKHDACRAGAIGNRKNSLLQIFSNGTLNENHGKEMFRVTNLPEAIYRLLAMRCLIRKAKLPTSPSIFYEKTDLRILIQAILRGKCVLQTG